MSEQSESVRAGTLGPGWFHACCPLTMPPNLPGPYVLTCKLGADGTRSRGLGRRRVGEVLTVPLQRALPGLDPGRLAFGVRVCDSITTTIPRRWEPC